MSTKKEKWANCVPLAVRRPTRSLVAKVLLISGEVTSDNDKELAMALSSGLKYLDDRL